MKLSLSARFSLLAFAVFATVLLVACQDEPEPVTIIKEVPVEVIKEVEVEKEVIKEVPVEKEVIKEVEVEKVVEKIVEVERSSSLLRNQSRPLDRRFTRWGFSRSPSLGTIGTTTGDLPVPYGLSTS